MRIADHKHVRLSDDHPTVPRELGLSSDENGISLNIMGVTFVDLSIWKPAELARFFIIAGAIVDEKAAALAWEEVQRTEVTDGDAN